MNMKTPLVLALALGLAASGSAFAGSNSTTFQVDATVIKECAIDGGNLVFPNTSLLTANVDATVNIQIECTGAVPYTLAPTKAQGNYSEIGLSYGLQSGSDWIGYRLYTDASRTTEFAPSAGTITGTSTGGVEQIPVYARIPAQTSQPAGVYSDVVSLSLTF